MAVEIINGQEEFKCMEKDIKNAIVNAVVYLLDNIYEIEPEHLNSYVGGIRQLMDLIIEEEYALILKGFGDEKEEDDQDLKDFLNKLDEYKPIKIIEVKDDLSKQEKIISEALALTRLIINGENNE